MYAQNHMNYQNGVQTLNSNNRVTRNTQRNPPTHNMKYETPTRLNQQPQQPNSNSVKKDNIHFLEERVDQMDLK